MVTGRLDTFYTMKALSFLLLTAWMKIHVPFAGIYSESHALGITHSSLNSLSIVNTLGNDLQTESMVINTPYLKHLCIHTHGKKNRTSKEKRAEKIRTEKQGEGSGLGK